MTTLVDFGPGAGRHGGNIVYAGPGALAQDAPTITADYLSGRRCIEVPARRRGRSRHRTNRVRKAYVAKMTHDRILLTREPGPS